MKQKLKIIALFIVCTVSIFWLVKETGAVTYGGNNTFFLPVFQWPTWEDYWTVWGSPNAYWFVTQQWSTQYAIMQKYNTAWTYFFSYAIVIRVEKTWNASTYSGSIIQFWNNSDCWDTSCIVSLWFDIVQTPFSGWLHYAMRILKWNYFNWEPILILDLDDYDQTNCAQWWTESDCIYVVKPNFIVSNLPWSVGTYFTSIDTYFYSVWTQVKHASFNSNWNLTTQTFYQSFLDLFYDTQNLGSLISTNTDFTTWYSHYWEDTSVSPVTVKMYAWADATARATDTYITQFLTSFSGAIDATLPNWLGATSIITQWQSWTWGTWTGTDFFADCWSFLDVWCYVKWSYEWIKQSISDFFISFMPTFWFSWNFDSCGSFASWTTQTTFSKFTNIIALINPFPPANNTEICTIFWSRTIVYWVMWNSENFFTKYIPWQVPQLEIDPHFIFGQTIVDIVTIFSMMYYIFYKKSND